MSGSGSRVVYEFGGFRLDPNQRRLICNADGRPMPLSSRLFETLLFFVERPGRLLDKSTLMKAIWPGVVVEENNLNQNISLLRRSLGESPGEHRFIATVAGRGYQFVAEVRTLSGEARSTAEQTARQAVPTSSRQTDTATAGPTVGAATSVAVLPFANLTRDPEKEYFGDGMAEELIHMLTCIPSLKVSARTSSFAYKGRSTDVRQIARELGVGAVIEGSVRGAGDRIRVTAQLVDAQSGFHIWSHSFDRHYDDLFKLQDELADAIVQALNVGTDELAAPRSRTAPSPDLEAYHLYLRARAHFSRFDIEKGVGATALLGQAIERDPAFARAHSLMALLLCVSVFHEITEQSSWSEALARADHHARRALSLDSGLAEAHAVLGRVHLMRGGWSAAHSHLHTALCLNPNDATVHMEYAIFLGSIGHVRQAVRESQLAHRLAPAAAQSSTAVCVWQSVLGSDAEAVRYADLAIDLGAPPLRPMYRIVYSQAALRAGRYAEAAEGMIAHLAPGVRAAGGAEVIKAIYAALEDPANTRAAIEALRKLRSVGGGTGMDSRVMVVLAMAWYTMLGDLDLAYATGNEALDRLQRFGTLGAYWGPLWVAEMLPFRRDARFEAFADRIGLLEYWRQHGPPESFELLDGRLICH
jgi:adenylate cyclase